MEDADLDPVQLKRPFFHNLQPETLQRIDYAVAIVLLAASLPHAFSPGGYGTQVSGRVLGLALGAAIPIAMRRRWPVPALALATVSLSVATGIGQSFAPDPFIAVPMYQVATVSERRRSVPALALASLALLVAAAVGTATHPGEGNATFSVLAAVAAWFVGDSVRERRIYLAGLVEQKEQKAREERERAQRGVAEERLRIARELHDVVAHSLSVIAVQSGVGSHVIDEHPEQAKQALINVGNTSRSALDELRRMLGVLRQEDPQLDLTPAPGIAELPSLIDQVRATGLNVETRIDEAAVQRIPPLVELAVYRIVQEALTNVVKHASAQTATIEIRGERNELVVEVTDDGRGSLVPYHSAPAEHHGIVGMRERTALFEGSLAAGPRPGGGWRVLARIPLKTAA
ncbi:MAG: sensor histidine kinase [Acidimicrobiales bacterium]